MEVEIVQYVDEAVVGLDELDAPVGLSLVVDRQVGIERVCEHSGGSYPVHDRGYKLLFENEEILRGLLVEYCQMDWVMESDVKLAAVDPAMIHDDLRASIADKLFWLEGEETRKSGYALIEFKSKPEKDTFLQMFDYEVGILRMMINRIQSQKVPAGEQVIDPIIPILIYNGEREWRPWQPLKRTSFEGPAEVIEPKFIDVLRLDKGELERRNGAIHKIFWLDQALVMGSVETMKRLRRSSEQMRNMTDAEYRTIMIWLHARLKRLLPDLEAEIDHVVQNMRRGREAEMAEIIENNWQRELREVAERAERKAKQQVARELLKRGMFELASIAEMTGLTIEDVEALRDSRNHH